MMTAEDQRSVFQGVKRRGDTLAVLSERATQKNISLVTVPRGCEDTYPKTQRALGLVTESEGDCVGFAVTARKGMLPRSRLAIGPFLPQQSHCD
jgi:hypothetical protein